MKYYPYPDWEHNPRFTYLGSEKNPSTGLAYDYYLHTDDHGDQSYTCRHGTDPADYGSGSLRHSAIIHPSTYLSMMSKVGKDYIFGVQRSRLFALMYLVFGDTPLITADLDV